MMTRNLFKYFGMAMSACLTLARLPMALFGLVMRHETQDTGMTRFKLVLTQWRQAAQDAGVQLRADMRSSSNGAVFNTMPDRAGMQPNY